MTSEAPRQRRFRLQISLGTLLWLMVVVGMSLTWWIDRRKLEERIQKLEGVQNGSINGSLWSVKEVLGRPDDPTGNAGKSWCPATTSTLETLDVGFGGVITTSSIEIYETYSLGAITKVSSLDRAGIETVFWQGADATVPTKGANAGVLKIKLPTSSSINHLRILLDGTKKPGWNCIDAVSITDPRGKAHWATSAQATTVYGGGPTTATAPTDWWAW